MADEPLRVTEAARRMGLSTRALLGRLHDGSVPYVMRDGIAHVPVDIVDAHVRGSVRPGN